MNTTETYQILLDTYLAKNREYDDLVQNTQPILEAEYMTKIGYLQLNLLEIKLQIKEIQYKIEQVNICIQKAEEPDFVIINTNAILQSAELKNQINQQTENITLAKTFLNNIKTISTEEHEKIKKIYFELAKKLHPDAIDTLTEKHQEIWEKVQKAYKNKDLNELLALQLVYAEFLEKTNIDENELESKIVFFKNEIQKIENKIVQLKKEFPFNLEHNLYDEKWIEARKDEIYVSIKKHQSYYQEMEIIYQTLCDGYQ